MTLSLSAARAKPYISGADWGRSATKIGGSLGRGRNTEPPIGIEPMTYALRVRRSTD